MFEKWMRFRPHMQLLIEGAGEGAGGGESSSERALEYLSQGEGAGEGQGAAAAAAGAGGAEAGGAGGGVDPAALAAALEGQGKPGEGQEPLAGAQGADGGQGQQPPAQGTQIDPQNWVTSQPVADTLTAVLGDYAKGADGKPMGMDQFKLVLEDAKALYEIADGRRSPDEMTALLKQSYPGALKSIAESAAKQLGMVLADPKQLQGQAPPDPAMERLQKIEDGLKEQERQREEAAQQQVRQKAFEGFNGAINTELNTTYPWLKDAPDGVKKFVGDMFGFMVSAQIGGNRDITQRFEQGNYTDAKRLFTEFNNNVLGFMQSWAKALVAQKTAQANNTPKIPARGVPPVPAGTPGKRDLSSFDGRMAAAMAELENPSS